MSVIFSDINILKRVFLKRVFLISEGMIQKDLNSFWVRSGMHKFHVSGHCRKAVIKESGIVTVPLFQHRLDVVVFLQEAGPGGQAVTATGDEKSEKHHNHHLDLHGLTLPGSVPCATCFKCQD